MQHRALLLGLGKDIPPRYVLEGDQMNEDRLKFAKSLISICLLSNKGVGKALMQKVWTLSLGFACPPSMPLCGCYQTLIFLWGTFFMHVVLVEAYIRLHPIYWGVHMM